MEGSSMEDNDALNEQSSWWHYIDKPPEEIKCPVLLEPIFDPYRSDCCKKLFSKAIFYKELSSCPLCRAKPFVLHEDVFIKQIIHSLKVQCKQCHWIGTVRTFKGHALVRHAQFSDDDNALSELFSSHYSFIDKPSDDVMCPVYHVVILHPYRSDCCSRVFSKCVFDNESPKCPSCRVNPFKLYNDVAMQEKIDLLPIQCNHCHWIGTVQIFLDHLMTQCLFVDTACPSCGQEVQRANLKVHKTKDCSKRSFVCLHCSMEDITEHHQVQCGEKVVPCPNQCGVVAIQHKQLKEHIDQCPYATLQCEYNSVGCKYTTLRNSSHLMVHHSDVMVDEHRLLLVKKFQIAYKQLTLLQHDNNFLRTKYCQLYEQVFSSIEYTMDNFYNQYSGWCSKPFYSHLGGYKMCMRVKGSKLEDGDSHLEVGIHVMKGEFDQDLEFPFQGHVTVQLVEVNEKKLGSAVCRKTYTFSRDSVMNMSADNGLLLQQSFVTLNKLHSISQYSPIKTLKFRVAEIQAPSSIRCGVDPQCSQLHEHLSHYPIKVEECNYCYKDNISNTATNRSALSTIADCIHNSTLQIEVLKGQNDMLKSLERAPHSVYSRPLEFEMSSFQYYYKYDYEWISSAFYTHFGGYRLCLDVEGQGAREYLGKYLYVVARMCAGDYDDELRFPFRGTITIQLVDHGPNKTHVEKVFSFYPEEFGDRVTALTDIRNEKRYDDKGLKKFISFEDLRNSRTGNLYLVNDTLTFRVVNITVKDSIKPLFTKPPMSTQLSTLLYLDMLTHEEIVAELLKDYPRYKVSRHGLVDSFIARFIIGLIGRGRM